MAACTVVRRSSASTVALVVIALIIAPSIHAQTSLATLQVNVTDAQGQVVPGATVTARETSTNVTRSGSTDGRGQYVIRLQLMCNSPVLRAPPEKPGPVQAKKAGR